MSVLGQPLVSVVVPAYNAAATIRRALDSALAQTYAAFEIIVIDDGSRDETAEIVSSYDSPLLRLIRLASNCGESGAMNAGIEAARGEFIAFLDADDEWLPEKLTKQMAAFGANPDAVLVTCGCKIFDMAGNASMDFGVAPTGLAKREVWRGLLAATYIAKPSVVARASALREVGPFDTTLPIAADQDMWIRLAMIGEVEFLHDCLTLVHDTEGSLTKVYATKTDRYVLRMIRGHVARRRGDLAPAEIRRILGTRYTSVGRNLYRVGRLARGASLLLRACALGDRVGENLWYLVTASPPARVVKALIRGEAPLPPRAAAAATGGSLLRPSPADRAVIPPGPPIVIVEIDTEAEFDWTGPFLRTHTGVQNLRQQARAQAIFDRLGVKPIYLVDYAVATQREGYEPLLEILRPGRCEIGAHLQPWENPPFAEELSERTSFNHNLPAWLQKEKLLRLTEAIVRSFGVRPVCYRSGRYGIGEEMARILAQQGYQIDLSVRPAVNLGPQHGPDFRNALDQPYWFGPERKLLEIPGTSGFVGLAARDRDGGTMPLPKALSHPWMRRLHAPGIFARLGLLEHLTLTPEGLSVDELKRLTRALLRRGKRVFTFTYHSSSLLPGGTPYVPTQADCERMLRSIEDYLYFFLAEMGGVAMTPSEFRSLLLPRERPRRAAALAGAVQ
jgi:glycosyltransferase involved in cell wall biosynthesis